MIPGFRLLLWNSEPSRFFRLIVILIIISVSKHFLKFLSSNVSLQNLNWPSTTSSRCTHLWQKLKKYMILGVCLFMSVLFPVYICPDQPGSSDWLRYSCPVIGWESLEQNVINMTYFYFWIPTNHMTSQSQQSGRGKLKPLISNDTDEDIFSLKKCIFFYIL